VRASIASSPQKQYSPKTSAVKSGEEVRIAVLGASGYTGAEVFSFSLSFSIFVDSLLCRDKFVSPGKFLGIVTKNLAGWV
jgi:N-acetyl-gamma-glutamyl-phosphate reductase